MAHIHLSLDLYATHWTGAFNSGQALANLCMNETKDNSRTSLLWPSPCPVSLIILGLWQTLDGTQQLSTLKTSKKR